MNLKKDELGVLIGGLTVLCFLIYFVWAYLFSPQERVQPATNSIVNRVQDSTRTIEQFQLLLTAYEEDRYQSAKSLMPSINTYYLDKAQVDKLDLIILKIIEVEKRQKGPENPASSAQIKSVLKETDRMQIWNKASRSSQLDLCNNMAAKLNAGIKDLAITGQDLFSCIHTATYGIDPGNTTIMEVASLCAEQLYRIDHGLPLIK